MKITKRQLKRIIKEEKRKLLSEQGPAWGTGAIPKIMEDYVMLDFAEAWALLDPKYKSQVLEVLQSYGEGGHDPEWTETVMMQNPAAIESAMSKLGSTLNKMKDTNDEAFDIYSALETALEVYDKGEGENEGRPNPTPHDPYGRRKV